MAFLSVAILAATANLIVRNGAVIAQQVIHSVGEAEAETKPARSVPSARQRAEQKMQYDQGRLRAAASRLVLALGNLDQVVRAQADGAPQSGARYDAVLAELDLAAALYGKLLIDTPAAANAELARQMHKDVRAQVQLSGALIQASREGRAALDQYAARLLAMNARLQKSIDGAWKIMGRVVARQSLLKLSADLDAIQASFASREQGGIRAGTPQLVNAENAFAFTLRDGEVSLRRSQGKEWLAEMRADLARLVALRARADQSEILRNRLTQNFARDLQMLMDTLAREPVFAQVKAPMRTQVPVAAQTTVVVADATSTPLPRSTGAESTARQAPVASPPNSVVAWISFTVLAVLAYICVVTILSVVRPVRRLVEATAQLAKGGKVQPLQPGGIRELDRLSQAFNTMADQLAVARQADLDAQRRLEGKVEERTRELKNLAERDPLTGLANRRQLFTALIASIEDARVHKLRVGAFFVDIDNFKTLNDSLGHAFGDRVLKAIAERLEESARPFGFAARLGGDEFMVVHEGAESAECIVRTGQAIVEAFQRSLEVEGRELIVSVSVGASIYPDHEGDAEALMRAADAALFRAKALGRSRLALFTPELLEAASAKFAIEQRLRRAIEKQEFELFYQPEVDLETLEVTAVEALLRWRLPNGNYECPGAFFDVAEESGLISEINDWVLRSAIEAASEWHHGTWPDTRVAINVSPRQFIDLRFTERLRSHLDEFRLPARCIELELTESVLQTGPTTIRALTELRAMGIAIALDDFGTGYSSMASLEQLPLTRVKLDRSLIARMDTSARSASIARATIGLCRELGLAVTAEGVERPEQFAALLAYRSLSLQGYLLARPARRDEVLGLLDRVPADCQELVLSAPGLTGSPVGVPDRKAPVSRAAPGNAK